jgi:hypothetical protein
MARTLIASVRALFQRPLIVGADDVWEDPWQPLPDAVLSPSTPPPLPPGAMNDDAEWARQIARAKRDLTPVSLATIELAGREAAAARARAARPASRSPQRPPARRFLEAGRRQIDRRSSGT